MIGALTIRPSALDQPLPEPPGVVGLLRVGPARQPQLLEPHQLDLGTGRLGGPQRLLQHDLGAAVDRAGIESEQSQRHRCFSFVVRVVEPGRSRQGPIGRIGSEPSQPSASAASRPCMPRIGATREVHLDRVREQVAAVVPGDVHRAERGGVDERAAQRLQAGADSAARSSTTQLTWPSEPGVMP